MLPSGASYLNINIVGTLGNPVPALTSAADGIAWMENANRGFVTDAGTRGRFAELLRALAAGTGPQVYHCTGGKARTLAQVGEIVGLTNERVRQIEIKAMKKLRGIAHPRQLDLLP